MAGEAKAAGLPHSKTLSRVMDCSNSRQPRSLSRSLSGLADVRKFLFHAKRPGARQTSAAFHAWAGQNRTAFLLRALEWRIRPACDQSSAIGKTFRSSLESRD